MKKLSILLFLAAIYTSVSAQTGYVGIGTITPAYTLDVAGTGHYSGALTVGAITLPSIDGSANQVLTTNGAGSVSWQTVSNVSGWSLTGNSGTSPSANFIGTTDNESLVFKANNHLAGKIDLTLNNAIFGYQSGQAMTSGTNCTFMGYQSGYANTSGPSNTGIGSIALNANTTGSNNTAVGMDALEYNTTGANNTGVGTGSLKNNTIAGYNAALGASALTANTSGSYNTATGAYALQANTSGTYNAAQGYYALGSNTSGSYNVAVGDSAGLTITSGSDNTFIGKGADASTASLTNAAAIGYNAKVAASNAIILGGTGSYAVNVGIGTPNPGNFLEINSGTGGVSGLRLKELPSGAVLFMSSTADVSQNNNNFYFDAVNYRLSVAAGSAPNSTLQLGGSLSVGTSTKTGSYTAGTSDHTLLCNTASGALTITLPIPSGATGRIYAIKKISSDANAVTIGTSSGASTIDGVATYSLASQYNCVELTTDGTSWYVLASH